MTVSAEALQALANAFQLVLGGGPEIQPGQPISAEPVPPETGLTATDFISAPVDLTFIAKNVRFAKPDLADQEIEGGVPFVVPAASAVDAVSDLGAPISGDDAVTGLPGVVGRLSGNIPLPVQVPVTLRRVEWNVRDAQGGPLSPGVDFLAPTGLDTLNVSFVFPPPEIVELTLPPQEASPVPRHIGATVTLAVGAEEVPVELPGLDVSVLPLQVPSVLALFRHRHFAPVGDLGAPGYVMFLVPSNAQLRTAGALLDGLSGLGQAAELLSLLPPPAVLPDLALAELAPVLRELADAVDSHPSANIQVRAADEVEDLSDITMVTSGLINVTANQSSSSLVLVGPPSRMVECFNAKGFTARRGQLDIIARSALGAVIRVLGAREPECDPGEARVEEGPLVTFGNALSSIRFAVAPG